MEFFRNYFSLIRVHNLRALTSILASKTLWIRHWVARLEIIFSLLFFFFEEEEEEEEEESFSEGALRSKLVIVPFVERFQAAAILSKSY